jgi:hypothetical protein
MVGVQEAFGAWHQRSHGEITRSLITLFSCCMCVIIQLDLCTLDELHLSECITWQMRL